MVRVQINCKHCRKMTSITSDVSSEREGKYYCTLNKMENNECPENCEWFIPDKVYVV